MVQNMLFSDSRVSLNLYRISSNFIETVMRCDFEYFCHEYEILPARNFLRILSTLQKCLFESSARKIDLNLQMIDWNFSKIYFQFRVQILYRKSTTLIKFCQNFHFLTFAIFIAKTSNKHFRKLDKNLRNFPSWHFFVSVTVFKKFRFEICNFKHWSCDISERYGTTSENTTVHHQYNSMVWSKLLILNLLYLM